MILYNNIVLLYNVCQPYHNKHKQFLDSYLLSIRVSAYITYT